MKNKTEVNLMSPLTWAYVGDSVYELYIREHLVQTTNLKPHKLHIQAIKYVTIYFIPTKTMGISSMQGTMPINSR